MTDEQKSQYYKHIDASCDAMIEANNSWRRADLSNEEKSQRWEKLSARAIELHEIAIKFLRSGDGIQ